MAWRLTFPTATFQTDRYRIDLKLGEYARCLVRPHTEKPDAPAVAAIEFQPHDPSLRQDHGVLNCHDPYVRQNDLIVPYPQTDPWQFGYQLDLRVHDGLAESISGIEVWLSIQTSLLESAPRIHVVPLASGPHWKYAGVLTADNHMAAILIHPLDQSDCKLVTAMDGTTLERLEVFGGFMEKGVIRRARLLLVWSDTKVDASAWQDVLQSFSASPLPLTV